MPLPTIGTMVPVSSQWRCRICRFERYHQVSVLRKDGSRYETSFYACSACSVMFLNPANFNADGSAAPEHRGAADGDHAAAPAPLARPARV